MSPGIDGRLLRVLGIRVECPCLDHIPATGPLLIVANHPHGIVDGLALSTQVRCVRPDVRLLANRILSRVPGLADLCFFVDPFDGPGAAARSQSGLRAAYNWLRQGGALVMFPAGEVAHRATASGSYAESPWQPTAARLAQATGAAVVPAFIDGTNSCWFYAAGRVHPRFRTALLVTEFLNKRGSTVSVRLGPAVPATEWARRGTSPGEATAIMFDAVQELKTITTRQSGTSAISGEVDALPKDCCLLEEGAFQVFCSRAAAIPATLQEIGRLREITYRAAGEGTGHAVDLDEFDERYHHLFVWDRRARCVVGAYRIGETDRIVAEYGIDGLYTRTLFRYDARLLSRLSPALELGRSFVRQEYQRSYSALLLLWKGIGRFIANNPQYRILFGPVSISARYTDHSRQLLMAFLQQNHRDDDLADLVESLNPPQMTGGMTAPTIVPRSVGDIDAPVLLRQYLKLNARLLGFNVDRGFGDALDALMMVDLTAVDRAILRRYVGPEAATRLLAQHRARAAA
jgi:putative hemolysin